MRPEEILTYTELEGCTPLPENLLLAFWDSIFGRDGTEVDTPKVRIQRNIMSWTWPFNGKTYNVYNVFRHGPWNVEHKTEGVIVKDEQGNIVLNLHMLRTPNGNEQTLFDYKWQGQTNLTPKQIMYWKLQKK